MTVVEFGERNQNTVLLLHGGVIIWYYAII